MAGRRRRVLLVGVVALALILAGCTSTAQASNPTSGPTAVYYNQTLRWAKCDGGECAEVSVPLDWAHPSGAKISLALLKKAALDGHPEGSIVYDPGGPGASGVDFLREYPSYVADKKVRTDYNIVGFDSRGVGHSTPVACLDQKQLGQYYYDVFPGAIGSTAWLAADLKAQAAFVKGCEKNTGALLGHLDTASAARDLDVVRAALGAKKLDYFGVSYGTKLALEYASMFPARVGRFVLDGIDEPDATGTDFIMSQSTSVQDVLDQYLAWCLTQPNGDCPFTGTVADAESQLAALLEKLDAHPVGGTEGRQLNGWNLATAVIDSLYSTSWWPDLDDAIHGASHGIADAAFQLDDAGYERGTNNAYSNLYEVYLANLCDDYTTAHTPLSMAAEAAAIDKVSPVLGPYLGYGAAVCNTWPYKPVGRPVEVTAKGSGPILLLSSLHDPATPFAWAQEAAAHLADGHLITRNGSGHGSYEIGNACIDNAVDAYFLHGTVPATDPKC